MKFVNALNEIHVNVWAMLLIGFGVALALHKDAATGGTLITGGFALLRTESKPQNGAPPDAAQKR